MSRTAVNPGIGRGHGIRTADKECKCIDCGAAFMAKRSDAKRCSACNDKRDRVHRSRPRPERVMGTRTFACIDCSESFTAVRIAKRCEACQRLHRRTLERVSERIRRYDTCPLCSGRKAIRQRHCNNCRIAFLRSAANRGANNPYWKGGRLNKDGYVLVPNPDKSRRRHSYVAEHILVWVRIRAS